MLQRACFVITIERLFLLFYSYDSAVTLTLFVNWKGFTINMNKTKIISGECQKLMHNTVSVRWIVVSVVEASSVIQYSVLVVKWVHKKCSGIECNMSKVMKSFICRGCLNPVTSLHCTSIDIGASANLELVNKFCCVSVDGDADAVVKARIRTGWKKFMQLVPLHTYRNI